VNGLIAAVVTPFSEDGLSMNLSVVEAQAKYLQNTGVGIAFVAGTTGESLSLTVDERMDLLEQWEQDGPSYGVSTIAHVGAESILDVLTLTTHAAEHGAIAIGIMPSVFFKPTTITNLGEWIQTAADAAPSLPIYYYHIPSQTGVEFDMLDLLTEMNSRGVSNFAGVKYTGLYETRAFPDLMRCQVYADGAYDIMSGREELMVEALAVGVTGFIGSQFNYGGDIYGQIYAETDLTKRNSLQLAAIVLLEDWINGVPAGVDGNKMLVNLAGIPVGPARLPSLPPSQDDYDALAQLVVEWCDDENMGGLFDPTPALCTAISNRR
jgi:N-acetylneuraminate lyase